MMKSNLVKGALLAGALALMPALAQADGMKKDGMKAEAGMMKDDMKAKAGTMKDDMKATGLEKAETMSDGMAGGHGQDMKKDGMKKDGMK